MIFINSTQRLIKFNINHFPLCFIAYDPQALHLLPDDWSIKKLGLFLQRSIRKHNHYYRTTAIEHSLAKWEHIRVKGQIIDEDFKRALITENVECQLCRQDIGDSAFVRYPNGVLIHMKCMKNKNICPVTGIWFGGIS